MLVAGAVIGHCNAVVVHIGDAVLKKSTACLCACHADCGAGVGRVSEQLLLHHFNTVDLLEPSKHLLDAAQKNLKAAIASGNFPKGHTVGHCLCHGLQEFDPEPQRSEEISNPATALCMTLQLAQAL